MGGVFTERTAIMYFAELMAEGKAVGVEIFKPHRVGRSYDITVALSNEYDSDVMRSEAEYWETRPEAVGPLPINADIGPDGWPVWEEGTSGETCSDRDAWSAQDS